MSKAEELAKITEFLDNVWGPKSDALMASLDKYEKELKVQQARIDAAKGKKGPDGPKGEDASDGEKGDQGARGARGERMPTTKSMKWEGHSATGRTATAKITNFAATGVMVAVTGTSLSMTGYKSLVTGKLLQGNGFRFSNGLFRNKLNTAHVCVSGLGNRLCAWVKRVCAKKTKKAVLTNSVNALKTEG